MVSCPYTASEDCCIYVTGTPSGSNGFFQIAINGIYREIYFISAAKYQSATSVFLRPGDIFNVTKADNTTVNCTIFKVSK